MAYHILLLIAAALIAWGWRGIRPYIRARRWIPVQANLTSVSSAFRRVVVGDGGVTIRYYFPEVRYAYQFKDRAYAGDRVSFELENIWESERDGWGRPRKMDWHWMSWSAGAPIEIFLNPAAPSEAAIVRDLSRARRSHHLAIVSGGVLVGGIWALLRWIS